MKLPLDGWKLLLNFQRGFEPFGFIRIKEKLSNPIRHADLPISTVSSYAAAKLRILLKNFPEPCCRNPLMTGSHPIREL